MPSPEQDRPSQAEIDEHYADSLRQAWSDAKDVFTLGQRVVVMRGRREGKTGLVIGAGVSLGMTGSRPMPKAWFSVWLDDSRQIEDYSANDLDRVR